jgi:hypothetical protein
MAFNIQNFKENLNNYGYIKNNKFEVFVQPPRFMANRTLRVNNREVAIKDLNELLRFRIEQVRIPGANLLSTDIVRYGVGISEKTPYNAQLYDNTFSFPTSIGQIPLGWNDNQDLIRIAVSITFSNYSFVGSKIVTNSPTQLESA